MYKGFESHIIGVVKINEEMVLLLYFEIIVVEINSEYGIDIDQVKKLGTKERSMKKLLAVEDAPLLRKLLKENLDKAGFEQITFFENGKDALSYLRSIVEDGKAIKDEVQLVITDVEMPLMDGHHLTKQIKEDPALTILPVIIFSSLITNDLLHKGHIVGASAQISRIEKLILLKKLQLIIGDKKTLIYGR